MKMINCYLYNFFEVWIWLYFYCRVMFKILIFEIYVEIIERMKNIFLFNCKWSKGV